MNWLIAALALVGFGLIGLGLLSCRNSRSADEAVDGLLPILIGLALIAFDALLSFTWVLIHV